MTTPPKSTQESRFEPEATATHIAYTNEADFTECAKKIKALGDQRRQEKIEKLRAEALKNATTKAERDKINSYNSVQDFTQGNKVDKTVDMLKVIVDYQERQRIMTLSQNKYDTEKKILYRTNKETLDKVQTKVAQAFEKAMERFVTELHKAFEAKEDITTFDFGVNIKFLD